MKQLLLKSLSVALLVAGIVFIAAGVTQVGASDGEVCPVTGTCDFSPCR